MNSLHIPPQLSVSGITYGNQCEVTGKESLIREYWCAIRTRNEKEILESSVHLSFFEEISGEFDEKIDLTKVLRCRKYDEKFVGVSICICSETLKLDRESFLIQYHALLTSAGERLVVFSNKKGIFFESQHIFDCLDYAFDRVAKTIILE